MDDVWQLSMLQPADKTQSLGYTRQKPETVGYIFENEWQSFRTKRDRNLELKSAMHRYAKPGRYTVAVKVIDIFGNDSMTLFPITVG